MIPICFVLGYSILSFVFSHLACLSFLPGMIPIDSKPPAVIPWRQEMTTLSVLDGYDEIKDFPTRPAN